MSESIMQHPLIPWLIIVLASWVGCSTVVIITNWMTIQKFKKHESTSVK